MISTILYLKLQKGKLFFLIAIILATFSSAKMSETEKSEFGDKCIIKRYNKMLLTEGVALLKEVSHRRGNKSCKSFVVTVSERGSYFVSAFMRGLQDKEYDIVIDNEPFSLHKIRKHKNAWENCYVIKKNDESYSVIDFSSGMHTITCIGDEHETPFIDAIKLAKTRDGAKIDRSKFLRWHETIKTAPQTAQYEKPSLQQTKELLETPDPDEPYYDYDGYLDKTFNYTFREDIYISEGQTVTFETISSDPYSPDPVMYVFVTDPDYINSCSWSDDDGGFGRQSKLTIIAPMSAYYQILIREHWSLEGTVDLYKDGLPWREDIEVAGSEYYSSRNPDAVVNFFTAKPLQSPYSVDTYIHIATTKTNPIKAYNDDYYELGSFEWGYLSRVNQLNNDFHYMFVSSYNTASEGTCDMYLHVKKGPTDLGFPNLHEDDVMLSSWPSEDYMCFGWAGGRTKPDTIYNSAINPQSIYTGKPWYVRYNGLASLDNFYGNVAASGNPYIRYANATTYTRVGATSENAIIDLLGTPNSGNYLSHAQVRKPGNDHMHGYDWESKLDMDERIFHPREALVGGSWGNIMYHYKKSGVALTEKSRSLGITRALTYEESKALGLTVSPSKETLTAEEREKLNNLILTIPSEFREKLDLSFALMNKKLNEDKVFRRQLANPYEVRKKPCYDSLLQESRKMGKYALIWLFDEMLAPPSNILLLYLFEDLTIDEYKNVFDMIVQEHFDNCYTEDGALIEYSPQNSCIKLIKYILADKF